MAEMHRNPRKLETRIMEDQSSKPIIPKSDHNFSSTNLSQNSSVLKPDTHIVDIVLAKDVALLISDILDSLDDSSCMRPNDIIDMNCASSPDMLQGNSSFTYHESSSDPSISLNPSHSACPDSSSLVDADMFLNTEPPLKSETISVGQDSKIQVRSEINGHSSEINRFSNFNEARNIFCSESSDQTDSRPRCTFKQNSVLKFFTSMRSKTEDELEDDISKVKDQEKFPLLRGLLYNTGKRRSIDRDNYAIANLRQPWRPKRLNDNDDNLEIRYVIDPTLNIRLTDNWMQPLHYDIKISTDFEGPRFEGSVTITFTSDDSSHHFDEISLNSVDIIITDGYYAPLNSNESIGFNKIYYCKTSEKVILTFKKPIAPSGQLHLNYRAYFDDKMRGLYKVPFQISSGEIVYGLVSNFAPTYSRRVFPCWDEPHLKSTFSITLVVPKYINLKKGGQLKMEALSNMPKESQKPVKPHRVTFHDKDEILFKETPYLSTHQLALIVGPFEVVEKQKVRIFSVPGNGQFGLFALEMATKALHHLEKLTQINLELTKLDLVIVPELLHPAASSWGLVAIRDADSLTDLSDETVDRKKHIAVQVGRYVAQQWIGALVSIDWWDQLWWKEGLSLYLGYEFANLALPRYNIWPRFFDDCYSRVLDLYVLKRGRPLKTKINHLHQIEALYADNTFHKAASLFKMMSDHLGKDIFEEGISRFLRRLSNGSANEEDLISSLEEVSDKPIRRLVFPYIDHQFYPLLTVEGGLVGNQLELKIEQDRPSARNYDIENLDELDWSIPLQLECGLNLSKNKRPTYLSTKKTEIVMEGVDQNWVKLNSGCTGLYRVAYSRYFSRLLWNELRNGTLPPLDRFNICNDLAAVCQSGKLPTTHFLRMMHEFINETDYTVWRSLDSFIEHVSLILFFPNTDFRRIFEEYAIKFYDKVYSLLSFKPKLGESPDQKLLRALVIKRRLAFGDRSVADLAIELFEAQRRGTASIDPDLREVCYCAVSRYADEVQFNHLFEIHRRAKIQEEKDRVCRALGFSRNYSRLSKSVSFAMSNEVPRCSKSDIFCAIGVTNPIVGWKFFLSEYNKLERLFGAGPEMAKLIRATSENLSTGLFAAQVLDFQKSVKDSGTDLAFEQSIEKICFNSAWAKRDKDTIREFLDEEKRLAGAQHDHRSSNPA